MGDILPIEGFRAEVVSADGALLQKPLPGAGAPNPACDQTEKRRADQTENARSLGTIITFGKVRILDLGDLTWDKELELVCPINKLGSVDVFIVSHHGWLQSNSPALLAAISPRLAIMDNGADKGGSPSSWDTIRKSPKLEGLWQLHFSNEGRAAHNSADSFIANLPGPDGGNYLKLSVSGGRQTGGLQFANANCQRLPPGPVSARLMTARVTVQESFRSGQAGIHTQRCRPLEMLPLRQRPRKTSASPARYNPLQIGAAIAAS